ncbi:MAG: molybdopterin-dependent oxidoreductase [Methanobacterium sp.]|nr:molybdopterin-dependent oxidoreductase [Methanobacterium sp.]
MNRKVIILIFLILIISVTFIWSEYTKNQTIKLDAVEVREYQGQKLSSVNDFRENSIKGPQYINSTNYRLEVTGMVENPRNYTYYEIINRQNYEKVITLHCVEGWDATILWKGILIYDLIKDSKPLNGSNTVIFYAYDNYTTSVPLDYLQNNQILMAFKMNNATLPPERGYPFQLVAESKWGYKWIKWITKIEITSNSNYQGYWESRGYSDSGDLDDNYLK